MITSELDRYIKIQSFHSQRTEHTEEDRQYKITSSQAENYALHINGFHMMAKMTEASVKMLTAI